MKKKVQYKILVSVLAFVLFLIHHFRFGGEFYDYVTRFIAITIPLISFYAAYLAIAHFKLDSSRGKSILIFLVALVMWWLADIIWILSGTSLIADLLWLGALDG